MVTNNYSQNEEDQINMEADGKATDNVVIENDTQPTEAIIDEAIEATAENGEVSEEQLEIQKLKTEVEEKQNRILRVQADLENYRRRVRIDQEAAAKYRAQSLIENILPVLDNFERGMAIETQHEETVQLLKGMEMVYRQLIDALKGEGLEEIEAVGAEFDPNFHQAIMQVEDENYDSNIITEALQKGYKLKDRVIRPAMVKVNQ